MKKFLLSIISFIFLSCSGAYSLQGLAAEAFGPVITKAAGAVYKTAAEKAVEKATEIAVEKASEKAAEKVIEKVVEKIDEDSEKNDEESNDSNENSEEIIKQENWEARLWITKIVFGLE